MVADPVDQAVAAGAGEEDVLARAAVGERLPCRRPERAVQVRHRPVVQPAVDVEAGPQVDHVVAPAAVDADPAHSADDVVVAQVAEDRLVAGHRLLRVTGALVPLGVERQHRVGRVEVQEEVVGAARPVAAGGPDAGAAVDVQHHLAARVGRVEVDRLADLRRARGVAVQVRGERHPAHRGARVERVDPVGLDRGRVQLVAVQVVVVRPAGLDHAVVARARRFRARDRGLARTAVDHATAPTAVDDVVAEARLVVRAKLVLLAAGRVCGRAVRQPGAAVSRRVPVVQKPITVRGRAEVVPPQTVVERQPASHLERIRDVQTEFIGTLRTLGQRIQTGDELAQVGGRDRGDAVQRLSVGGAVAADEAARAAGDDALVAVAA